VRRIYADFSSDSMKGWKDPLNAAAFRTIHKYAYTTGKSSTDTALIIDAMDLLHSKSVNGFCIVSSDSDFTGLAVRIREEGYFVMGIGRKHTPEAFVKACEKFTYAEILSPNGDESAITASTTAATVAAKGQKPPKNILSVLPPSQETKKLKPVELVALRNAFQTVMNNDVDDSGHATLSRISEQMRKNDPAFDPRNYGFNSFKKFCEAARPYFELVLYHDNKDKPAIMCLRQKQKLRV
jgi:hypothetical protein